MWALAKKFFLLSGVPVHIALEPEVQNQIAVMLSLIKTSDRSKSPCVEITLLPLGSHMIIKGRFSTCFLFVVPMCKLNFSHGSVCDLISLEN